MINEDSRNSRDGHSDINLESTSSRLDSIFRSLRNGRHRQHGHPLSMWADDQQSGGPNTSSIPSGLEDLLVPHLRPPTPEKAPDGDTIVDAQTQDGTDQLQASSGMVPEPTAENIGNNESVPTVDESRQAVSEESSESEATLGESLWSLDVEIGSADGHDDSAERQGPVDSARNQVFLDWEVKEQGR
ncbi:Armadillo-type fold [Artemisia annua]|uniref:Armadillo-type fold n=1 Tax=Artemisia annua TaxID=35608 RepID=A0A2U1M259_ARTAN|nr:Armadillo-type fold [Artemisia annua]